MVLKNPCLTDFEGNLVILISMKIDQNNGGNATGISERSGTINNNKPRVVIARNLAKERETLDRDGNVIDPRTKQIIKRAEDNK